MEIIIYKQDGTLKATVSPSENSTHSKSVMGDNVVNLSFVTYENLQLDVNDYIIFAGERFTLTRQYRPAMKSTVEYEYNCQFYGIQAELKKAVVLKMVDDDMSTKFTLTAPAAMHLQLIIDNINRIKGTLDWTPGEVVESGSIDINYDKTYCFDALTQLANALNTEWWVEGSTVNLSRCEFGNPAELGYENGLTGGITKEQNDNTKFFTRLIPLGSTRNIVKEDYGFSRLQLPGGVKVIEQNTEYGIVEEIEEEAFSHIYPRRLGTIGSVRSKAVKIEGKDAVIYYFTDPGQNFNPNEYEIPGLVKTIVFQSGELNGRDFEVNYNATTREFEIINQYPYDDDQQMPGGALIPQKDDAYILYNLRMPQEFYALAEQEYLQAVRDYLDMHSKDVAVYKCNTDYIELARRGFDFNIGQRVNLHSHVYFASGVRASRIISFNRKLQTPTDGTIDCSYAVAKGRIEKIEDNVVDIQRAFQEQLNKQSFQILKSWDNADPSEYNVLSAVRVIRAIGNSIKQLAEQSDTKYLRKDIEDTAAALIRFASGVAISGIAQAENLTVEKDAIFKNILTSGNFVSGFPGGAGWALFFREFLNAAGQTENKAVLEIDDLVVRGAVRLYEMVVSQMSGENSTRLTSDSMRVESIDTDTHIIYLDTDRGALYNPFQPGDILMVQQYANRQEGETGFQITKQYELTVTAAGLGSAAENGRTDWIKYTGFIGDLADVTSRDVLTRVDHLTNPDRKGILKQTATEPNSPYLDVVYGMKTNPGNSVRARYGKLSGIINAWWGQLQNYGIYSDNAYLLGDFRLRTGEDIRTKFEVIEGMLHSAMQSIQYNLTEEDNFFTNATFTRNMYAWEHDSSIDLYDVDGQLLDIGVNFLSNKETVADVVEQDGRLMLRLKDATVRQLNKDIHKPAKGSVLYLGFRYLCKKAGTLSFGFTGTANGYAGEFLPRDISIPAGSEYIKYETSGIWDGSGDFQLSFTGDIYLEKLYFTNHPLDDYKKEVATVFEQTNEYIKSVAKDVDKVNSTIKESGWITTAEGNKMWSKIEAVDALGNKITTHEGSFHVTATAIESIVTRVDDVSKNGGIIDQKISSAGWITTADGNKLWSKIETVDALGNKVTTHEGSFHVSAAAISTIVSRIDTTEQTIRSAGWLTTADGNKLWASKQLEDGSKIISYINQTPDRVTINADKIKLEGITTINRYVSIGTDGKFTAKEATIDSGTFRDVIIKGSYRSSFESGYYKLGSGGGVIVSTLGLQNNNHVVIPGSGGGNLVFHVPFTADYNGFQAVIVNDDFEGEIARGMIVSHADSGKYFYENGRKLTDLYISPKQGVEMIGLGEGNTFRGWLITNRFATTGRNNSGGFTPSIMYAGTTEPGGGIRKAYAYDGTTLTCTRQSEGRYRITFVDPFTYATNYFVMLTGVQRDTGRFACVSDQQSSYFDVYTGDDNSPNNSSFNFLVYSTAAFN